MKRSPPWGWLTRTDGPSMLAVGIFVAMLCLVAFAFPSVRRRQTDFLSFYTGVKLAGSPHFFSVTYGSEIQRDLNSGCGMKAFIRPPFYAVLLSPAQQEQAVQRRFGHGDMHGQVSSVPAAAAGDLARRLWRFAGGFAVGTGVLLGISFAVQGWDWPW